MLLELVCGEASGMDAGNILLDLGNMSPELGDGAGRSRYERRRPGGEEEKGAKAPRPRSPDGSCQRRASLPAVILSKAGREAGDLIVSAHPRRQ